MPPAPRSGPSAAWLSVGVGAAVLAVVLAYAWHVEQENAAARAKARDIVVNDRPPIHYGTGGDEDALPARLPLPPRTAAAEFDSERRAAETLADQGEFAAALDAVNLLASRLPKRAPELDGLRTEIDALVDAACEEAEARAKKDPVKGLDALDELAGRVPAAAGAKLGVLRGQLSANASREAAKARLLQADMLEKDGKFDEAVVALLDAAHGLLGDAKERALIRAARLLQRARYEGVVTPARLAALDLVKLDAVERAVERALAAADDKAFNDALRQLQALPESDPELVGAVILRGGTPVDAPTGERVYEHRLAGGETRRYAVSVPDEGLPTRPRPLLLLLEPGASSPESARGVARGWRSALGGEAIVAVGVPDEAAGWGPNRRGEDQVPAILADLRKRHLFDPDRVVVAGKSAGAHGVWFQAMRYGDRYAAFVGVAGTPYSPMYGSHWLEWIGNLTLAPARALAGAKDEVFPIAGPRRFAEIAKERACRVELVEVPDRGHELAMEDLRKALAWGLEQKRDSFPKELDWSTDNVANGRCAWIEIAGISKDAGEVTVNFVDDAGKTVERRRISKDCARVRAAVRAQRIEITADLVSKLRILWSDRFIDVAKSVTVVVNGRELSTGVPGASAAFAVGEARRSGRRDRVFVGETVIDVPEPARK
ncbi:MAG: hypothetical protein K8T20_18405 [Planctomycetes bacterium]|nr:hypothetical protein [Planctomycetota bacterium]